MGGDFIRNRRLELAFLNTRNKPLVSFFSFFVKIENNNVKHEDSDSKEEKSIKEFDEIYDYLLENHFKRSDFFDEKKEKHTLVVV